MSMTVTNYRSVVERKVYELTESAIKMAILRYINTQEDKMVDAPHKIEFNWAVDEDDENLIIEITKVYEQRTVEDKGE